jgi:hypothetical protein
MTESQRERIVRALLADGSALRRDALELTADCVLASTVRDLVDTDELQALIFDALTEANVARAVERHVRPALLRARERIDGSSETLGALVPAASRDKIAGVVRSARTPRLRWTKGAVDPALIHRLLAPVWTSVLVSFLKRVPLPGLGGPVAGAPSRPPSIAERLTRSVQERAEKLVDAGRSVMGGLGSEMEKRFSAAARDFSEGAAQIFWDALVERLASDEGRRLVDEITDQFVDHTFRAELRGLSKDVFELPLDDVLALASEVVPHGAAQEIVREIVAAELAAFLDAESDRSLGDALSELGVLEGVRRAALARADHLAKRLFATPAFGEWLSRLLDA